MCFNVLIGIIIRFILNEEILIFKIKNMSLKFMLLYFKEIKIIFYYYVVNIIIKFLY